MPTATRAVMLHLESWRGARPGAVPVRPSLCASGISSAHAASLPIRRGQHPIPRRSACICICIYISGYLGPCICQWSPVGRCQFIFASRLELLLSMLQISASSNSCAFNSLTAILNCQIRCWVHASTRNRCKIPHSYQSRALSQVLRK
ncbi:hypothetical protein DENSPDRAFT_594420 [Dentipellis sp. KUC8613]|nr:hypothetical protein DENSPDRAFT_594420 [Dentipellis sp. KUC8613]